MTISMSSIPKSSGDASLVDFPTAREGISPLPDRITHAPSVWDEESRAKSLSLVTLFITLLSVAAMVALFIMERRFS